MLCGVRLLLETLILVVLKCHPLHCGECLIIAGSCRQDRQLLVCHVKLQNDGHVLYLSFVKQQITTRA